VSAALWVALTAALAAPPTHSFEYYPSTREVLCILPAGDALLVGTGGGLLILRPGERRLLASCTAVRGLLADPDRPGAWLVASDRGLFRLTSGTLEPVLQEPTVGLGATPNGYATGHLNGVVRRWEGGHVVQQWQLPTHSCIHSVAADGGGLLAAGVDGLWRLEGEHAQAQRLAGTSEETTVLALAAVAGGIWAGTADGLFRWARGEWARVPVEGGRPLHVLCIGPGDAARGWELTVGTDADGLLVLQGGKLRQVWNGRRSADKNANEASVQALAASDRLWLGTCDEGLWEWGACKAPEPSALHVRGEHEPPDNAITALTWAWDAGRLYVGTSTRGLASFRAGRFNCVSQATGLPDDWVSQVATDGTRVYFRTSNGNVYTSAGQERWRQVGKSRDGWPHDWTSGLGNDGRGLWASTYNAFYLRGARTWKAYAPKPQLQGKLVLDVAQRDGRFWIATHREGLLRWDPASDRWDRWTQGSGLSDTWVTCVESFGDGVWAGTFSGGLYRFTQGASGGAPAITRFSAPDCLPSDRIACLLSTPRGLWIGTVGGLAWTDDRRWRSWTAEDGLPANEVRALACDGTGIWAGTDAGLCRGEITSLLATSP
jgi:ligand-binding sensor domain-containing protein